jgi:transcriptional regulator of aromatic amino acid metabolism
MARRRFHAPELLRALEGVEYPVYALDDQRQITFANQACLDWLGITADDWIGCKCCYRSAPAAAGTLSELEAKAAQLCPPPKALQGEALSADIALPSPQGLVYRQARFLPLAIEGDEPFCIVVVVDSHDSPSPTVLPAGVAVDESMQLHELLRRFHATSALRYSLERIVGTSQPMQRARAQAAVAASSLASVLLVGHTGSGRRHMAAAIHAAAASGDGSLLVPLDCAVLNAEMFVSNLQDLIARPAVGRASIRGLLLCDVDKLAPEAHATAVALMRAGNFRFRMISTGSEDLVPLSRKKLFNEQLATMLSTIVIELPPLAERRQDIPLLAQSLIEQANARGGKQLGGFTPEALDRLHAYPWPGNVAELAAVVDDCHARAAGAFVPSKELPDKIRHAAEAAARPRRKEEPIVLDEFMAKIERELIERALARAKNNKARAARLLGLTRPRLYRRMVQLGLIKEAGE